MEEAVSSLPIEYLIEAVVGVIFLFGALLLLKKRQHKPRGRIQAIKAEKLMTLEEALQNTKKGFFEKIANAFSKVESVETEDIEEVLYTSDIGPKMVQRLLLRIQEKMSESALTIESLRELLRSEMRDILKNNQSNLEALTHNTSHKPEVWMVVGVNGAGKTTTIGKLANQLAQKKLKVLIAAGDTFRAAAKEQLKVWADRSSVLYFSPEGVENPSGVAFDAVKKAQEEQVDVAIIDTAGRLHTQSHLMEELKKIKRVIEKAMPGAPHQVLLVLDANSGQNALIQAREFHEALGVTGAILTKMDGTAKGGVVLGLAGDLGINIKLIGIGEKVEDLRPFNSEEFISSII